MLNMADGVSKVKFSSQKLVKPAVTFACTVFRKIRILPLEGHAMLPTKCFDFKDTIV